jgi:hypothetical protein
MTIAPEPMTRMVSMSVGLGIDADDYADSGPFPSYRLPKKDARIPAHEEEKMIRSKWIPGLLVLALLLCSPALFGADSVVLRVVVVQTDNAEGYLKEIEKGKALLKRLESPAVIRVWRARFAGENAGAVVVSVEHPNMAAFAKDDAKIAADGEYQAWLKGLDKFRKIVSDSLYSELKP